MKLTLQIGIEGDASTTTQEITIKNPKATVANLRAAIAVNAKIAPNSFGIFLGGAELATPEAKLSEANVTDGTVLEVRRKRPRDDDAAAGATSSSAAAAQQRARPQPSAEQQQQQGGATVSAQSLADLIRQHVGEADSDDDGDDDGTSMTDPSDADIDMAFDFPLLAEGEGEDDGDDEEETPEMAEQSEIVVGLLGLPNFETLKSRFDSDPRAAMQDIQNTNPQLFNLIARHTAFFLEFIGDAAATMDEVGDGDGDSDSDDSAVAEARRFASRPIMASPATAPAATTAAAATTTGAAASSTTTAAGRVPTPADTEKIEGLMALGFPRDKATEAFFKHGRNPDRAAMALFEAGVPTTAAASDAPADAPEAGGSSTDASKPAPTAQGGPLLPLHLDAVPS